MNKEKIESPLNMNSDNLHIKQYSEIWKTTVYIKYNLAVFCVSSQAPGTKPKMNVYHVKLDMVRKSLISNCAKKKRHPMKQI